MSSWSLSPRHALTRLRARSCVALHFYPPQMLSDSEDEEDEADEDSYELVRLAACPDRHRVAGALTRLGVSISHRRRN